MSQTQESNGIINILASSMSKLSVEEYTKMNENGLSKLNKLRGMADKLDVKTFDDYQEGMVLKSFLSSLYCYAFINNKDNWEEVGDIENIVGQKLLKFVKKQVIKDSKVKTVCRYLLWGRYYYAQNNEKIYQFLNEHNVLRKSGGSFFIIGFHCKVGDNTFTVDWNNRQHRNYVENCGFQAIYLKNSYFKKFLEGKRYEIPVLEDFYEKTSVCDGKHCIRSIGLKHKEKTFILDEFCGK